MEALEFVGRLQFGGWRCQLGREGAWAEHLAGGVQRAGTGSPEFGFEHPKREEELQVEAK